MKLLLDQNLSHRLVASLSEAYPNSTQVSLLGMGDASDKVIWEYAREHGYVIVTLDADFHEFSLLWSGPPQIIWLRCGNQPKQIILKKLLKHRESLEAAVSDSEVWCIELY